MFGYMKIYKEELKVKDYRKYQAYYCGLCKRLKEKYGFCLLWDGACTEERIREFAPMGVDGFVLGTGLLFGHRECYRELIERVRRMEGEK